MAASSKKKYFRIVELILLMVVIHIPEILFCQVDSSLQTDYWARGKIYSYKVVYRDSLGNIISDEEISIEPTGEKWEIDEKQTLATYSINYHDSTEIKLSSTSLNGKIRPWERRYREGVISNKTSIWMHPVRSNQYVLTEIAPFPEVRFPVTEDTCWASTLWIYEAFGSFEGTVESSYCVGKNTIRTYSFGEISCWPIDAVGIHDKLGENKLTIYFNSEIGFVEFDYHFFNGHTINFTLVSFEKK